MFKKLTLAAAAGAGYVLGARAGKDRYRQIESKFRELAGKPAVQDATASLKETAAGVADTAKATVNEKVEAVTEKVSEKTTGSKGKDTVVDLGTGANTGAKMAGAAPSVTAPDVTRP